MEFSPKDKYLQPGLAGIRNGRKKTETRPW